jgi:murein DD-endopeptidase MepM/ murein hydrolase activator NlpD
MKKVIFILFFIILFVPFVYSQNTAILHWDEPLVNENNKPLLDLDGFFIYFSAEEFNSVPTNITKDSCISNSNCFFISKHQDENKKDYSFPLQSLLNTRYFVQVLAVDKKFNYITSNPPPIAQTFPEEFFSELNWPVKNPMPIITSCYGWRKLGTGDNWHDGIDIGLPVGSDVLAVADGIIVGTCIDSKTYWPASECNPRTCGCRGTYINMYHPSLGTYSQYNHLSALKVSNNDVVKQGDVIALSGNTGISSGPHLDFKYFFSSNMAKRENNPVGNPLCYLSSIEYVLQGQSCKDAPDGLGWISACPLT